MESSCDQINFVCVVYDLMPCFERFLMRTSQLNILLTIFYFTNHYLMNKGNTIQKAAAWSFTENYLFASIFYVLYECFVTRSAIQCKHTFKRPAYLISSQCVCPAIKKKHFENLQIEASCLRKQTRMTFKKIQVFNFFGYKVLLHCLFTKASSGS